MDKIKSKMLLATLSLCNAERDQVAFNVASILEHGYSVENSISLLKDQFEKIAKVELTMEAIKMYYAQNINQANEKEVSDDNNS